MLCQLYLSKLKEKKNTNAKECNPLDYNNITGITFISQKEWFF